MKKYRCILCGYIYDDSKEEVKFEDLPDDWVCPLCGASKKDFKLIEDKEEKEEESKRVSINPLNVAIYRDNAKCINCGICK